MHVKHSDRTIRGGGGGLGSDFCLLNLPITDLNRELFFVTEIRNQKGKEYHGNTIYEILMSLQHFLRQNDRGLNFNSDFQFSGLRNILDAKMKFLAREGIDIHRKKADVIYFEQEDLLWQNGIFRDDTSQKLLDTDFYSNGIKFCLRGGSSIVL